MPQEECALGHVSDEFPSDMTYSATVHGFRVNGSMIYIKVLLSQNLYIRQGYVLIS